MQPPQYQAPQGPSQPQPPFSNALQRPPIMNQFQPSFNPAFQPPPTFNNPGAGLANQMGGLSLSGPSLPIPPNQQQSLSRNESPNIFNAPRPSLTQPPPQLKNYPAPPPAALRPPQSSFAMNQPPHVNQQSNFPMNQPQLSTGAFAPPPPPQPPQPANSQFPGQLPRPPFNNYNQGLAANQPPPPPPFNSQQPQFPMPNTQQLNSMNGQQSQFNQAPGPYIPGSQAGFQPQSYQQQPQPGFQQPAPFDNQKPQSQKMDMDQIPNPIEVMIANQTKYGGEFFETNEAGKVPPLTSTQFVCKDFGNCNPRYIRSSIYSVPNNTDLLKQSKLPFALCLTPFAELAAEEREPPVSDLGELGPVRCKRCKAYMSPFMSFIDNGKRFTCPFCDDVTPVPQEYFNHLDHMGRRVDMYERPELCCGSYEFVATKDYCRLQTLPQPPAFIFMIDVSINSVRSGLLHVLCPYIKNVILPNLPKDGTNPAAADNESPIRVGFVTYDKELHFYNLKSTLAAPQMMIVSDIEEVFVPILDGFLVKLSESKSVIDALLDALPNMFNENKETELILGPVVEAGVEALKSAKTSGKLFIFHTNLPNALASGQLKNRDDKKLLGTDKEKQLLTSQSDYYAQLGKKCVESGCCVDLFLMPNQFCDVASLSDLTRKTAGQIYKYDFFMADSHGLRLCEDLRYAVEGSVAFDAVMKVRTSTGIKAVDYLGNFSMYNTDVELAGVNKTSSFAIELKHEDKLNENGKVYVQMALLYTGVSGQRRIRLHNLSLNVCTHFSQVFSSCELDVFINYMAKLACRSVLLSAPKSIKENLVQQVSHILAAYRKNCTNSPQKGQFILPDTLKLLPVFSNSILKSDAISGAQNITVDDRAWLMYRLMSMDIKSTYAYFYPRVMSLHDLDGPNKLPVPIRCLYERLKDDGIYLLENGIVMYLWIGSNVDPSSLQNLFGVPGLQQLNVEKCKVLEIDTPISINVRSVIKIVNEQRKSNLKLIVVRQRDNLEIFFKNLLVEDQGTTSNNAPSYVEFLHQLHREIKNILD